MRGGNEFSKHSQLNPLDFTARGNKAEGRRAKFWKASTGVLNATVVGECAEFGVVR